MVKLLNNKDIATYAMEQARNCFIMALNDAKDFPICLHWLFISTVADMGVFFSLAKDNLPYGYCWVFINDCLQYASREIGRTLEEKMRGASC